MDPTHFLAAQTLSPTPKDRPASDAEIDAFYDTHGHSVFARAFRFRRWLHRFSVRPAKAAQPTRGFAPLATNR